MYNDYTNLSSEEYFDIKGYCEDLTEGKYSLPIIHAIQSDKVNGEVSSEIKKWKKKWIWDLKIISFPRYCASKNIWHWIETILHITDEKIRKFCIRTRNNESIWDGNKKRSWDVRIKSIRTKIAGKVSSEMNSKLYRTRWPGHIMWRCSTLQLSTIAKKTKLWNVS